MTDTAAEDNLQVEAHLEKADFERINGDGFMAVFVVLLRQRAVAPPRWSEGTRVFFGQMRVREKVGQRP
jgi:hypothetical protein